MRASNEKLCQRIGVYNESHTRGTYLVNNPACRGEHTNCNEEGHSWQQNAAIETGSLSSTEQWRKGENREPGLLGCYIDNYDDNCNGSCCEYSEEKAQFLCNRLVS